MLRYGIIFLIIFNLTSCTKINTNNSQIIKINSYDLIQSKLTCTNKFIPHKIPHKTSSNKKKLIYYVSNGAGVSLADLNNDNLIDIVLAGLDQKPSILLNMGNFKFDKYELDAYGTRGVYSVDIDGDGILEIVFTLSPLEISISESLGIYFSAIFFASGSWFSLSSPIKLNVDFKGTSTTSPSAADSMSDV